ncbi:transcription termination factor MTEF1, chloroplastic isoform X2 [Arabidopsis lyrata subsp. lyrata]|uniref:transcription termination factor MTEF1, chloroplastic isoform X2 n=1 Tax=Arabidopsis lyrata subsp. lyrata TaxID=81972 RepID=UPI000A29B191|nr:transcription termination factor MTEF1, chloroplastic isoform X2 [Arabidopsis lyrata subsp. lyrata]XP_020883720.1 transcription termination factor MTEF1, chloroplastic isoform X2 [Arabidopsis lyrata subsp. lyrata]|eukprot:XP_020866882.1 transcription termination factor MTEF1, chloroplastic isoform X2 [Arabidopsis lyrata subsp. lyrata]
MQQEALSFLSSSSSSSFPSLHHNFPTLSRLRFHNFPALSFKPNTSSSSLFKSPNIPSLSSTTATTETLESSIHEKLIYLDSLGIDFLTLINRHPPLLSTALSAVESVVDYMTTPPINFTLQDFRRLVSMCPELLTSPLTSHTIPVITFLLREVGVDSIFDLRQALRRRPRLLACSVDHQLRPTLYFLQRIGILDPHKHTYLLSCSVEHKLVPRIDFFEKLGFSRRSATAMFKRFPQLFNYSIAENYEPKLKYLMVEMERDVREVLEFPQYFSFSLENRIKPRHEACAAKGVRFPLPVMLKTNEAGFRDTLEELGTWKQVHFCNE